MWIVDITIFTSEPLERPPLESRSTFSPPCKIFGVVLSFLSPNAQMLATMR
jgi:hypothetical protein